VFDGQVVRIPSGVSHQAEALTDTFAFDLFSPLLRDRPHDES
jgi:quercetin dioxygenase-like cupin family protein